MRHELLTAVNKEGCDIIVQSTDNYTIAYLNINVNPPDAGHIQRLWDLPMNLNNGSAFEAVPGSGWALINDRSYRFAVICGCPH